MLSNTIGKACRKSLHKQDLLSIITGEASTTEGKVVHPAVGEVRGSTKGSQRTQWSNKDRADLLQEIDFL